MWKARNNYITPFVSSTELTTASGVVDSTDYPAPGYCGSTVAGAATGAIDLAEGYVTAVDDATEAALGSDDLLVGVERASS